jgi:hypothetical protein
MNIFHLDVSPDLAARWLCDKHIPKMILETGQMLSTAHRILGSPVEDKVYKKAYINHPMTVWVRETGNNYQWAYCHLMFLIEEFHYRGFKNGQPHATETIADTLSVLPPSLLDSYSHNAWMRDYTKPPKCMPEEYHEDCHIEAYRSYYINEKRTFKDGSEAVWERGRSAPYWWH